MTRSPAFVERIPASRPANELEAYLAECRSQKAGTKQHEAGRCERKKSVGDKVVVAHVTPTTPDALPNSLKLSEFLVGATESFLGLSRAVPNEPLGRPGSSSGTIAFKCVGQKNACTHQAHHRCNCLDHRTSPLRPCNPQNDSIVAQSKRFKGGNRRSVVSDDLLQQVV
jgi:hypothetical protein